MSIPPQLRRFQYLVIEEQLIDSLKLYSVHNIIRKRTAGEQIPVKDNLYSSTVENETGCPEL